MTTPMWITKELFEDSLRSFHGDKSIKVLGYSCKAAVSTGENYTSEVFRVRVTYGLSTNGNKDTVSLIVKCSPRGGMMETLQREIHLFEKESHMFSTIIPKMYEILGERGVFSSNCIKSFTEPIPIIILEDISPLGFIMHERQCGLDLDHCLKVLEKLALFHAISVVLCEKDSAILTDLYSGGLYPNKEVMADWISLGFKSLTEAVGRWPGFDKYHVQLKKLGERALTKCYASWAKKLGGFNVLNHGDLWINNIMFSYEPNGKLKDVRFVDFQLVIYGSPAIDLHYFLATSPADDVKEQHMDYLLDFYYAHLLATLTKLKYSLERIPTRADFLADFRTRAFYGLIAAATVAPIVRADSRKDATFEDLFKDDSDTGFRYHAYNNDAYKAAMTVLLPYYDSLGIF